MVGDKFRNAPKLPRAVAVKLRKTVLENRDKVYLEIRETRDLYDLLLKLSNGKQLTDAEKAAAKSQLLDICKTIPALAIFVLPFGSILLAVLIKFLPFNILPTAFNESEKKAADALESRQPR
ncbi:MAG: LETM1 domain-containing protein [bacterium]